MLKMINANIIIPALAVILSNLPVNAQFFSSPFSASGNPFTSSIIHGYGPGSGFTYAPGLVTSPFVPSPFSNGLGYQSFGGGWLGRPIGYGGGYGGYAGYGGYNNFGNFGYPGGISLGGLGGNPFTNGYGYPGGFGAFNGYGGYGGYGSSGEYGWGAYGGQNPFTGGANFSPYGSTGELGTLGPHQVIQSVPSKASGNYYQPSSVDTSASGSYYADTAAPSQQTAPAPRHNGWNSQSNWTSPSGDSNFWGSGGNSLPKDLNSVPWNK